MNTPKADFDALRRRLVRECSIEDAVSLLRTLASKTTSDEEHVAHERNTLLLDQTIRISRRIVARLDGTTTPGDSSTGAGR